MRNRHRFLPTSQPLCVSRYSVRCTVAKISLATHTHTHECMQTGVWEVTVVSVLLDLRLAVAGSGGRAGVTGTSLLLLPLLLLLGNHQGILGRINKGKLEERRNRKTCLQSQRRESLKKVGGIYNGSENMERKDEGKNIKEQRGPKTGVRKEKPKN